MGDGTVRAHQEEQVEVSCESCHGPAEARSENAWREVDEPITHDLLRLRAERRPSDERVRLGRRGTPLWNLRPTPAGWTLVTKLEGKRIRVSPTPSDADHRMNGHAHLSCSACHAAAAPTCSSCHTRLDPGRKQWDFSAASQTAGAWIEESESFGFAPPTLGVRADGTIVPAIPGMILDIDRGQGAAGISTHRLFAPIEPHTTGKKARSCESCHLSPAAIGLGTGRLDLAGKTPTFIPEEIAVNDPSLAADGWTRLFPEKPGVGTRTGFRSLDAAQQRRVLAVGFCLACHPKATDAIWRDFDQALVQLSRKARCPLSGPRGPAWITDLKTQPTRTAR